jgi:HAD superfamily hydrolase (TIGR01549 family)
VEPRQPRERTIAAVGGKGRRSVPLAGRRLYPTRVAVRTILFDLDNTLWHFPVPVQDDVLHARCAEQIAPLLAGWGIACDAMDLSRRILDAVGRAHREAAAGGLLSPDWSEALDGVLQSAAITLDPNQLDALWTAWQVDGARLGRQLYPDTVTTLEWAKQQGYRLGLVSNRWFSAVLLQRELEGYNLGRTFDGVTVSADAGWLKPHPEIFYTALRALGAEPAETVMVGDSLRNDIAGAKMLGMRAVWKRNGRRTQQPDAPAIPPDATIDDLWELRRVPFLARENDPLARAAGLVPGEDRYAG